MKYFMILALLLGLSTAKAERIAFEVLSINDMVFVMKDGRTIRGYSVAGMTQGLLIAEPFSEGMETADWGLSLDTGLATCSSFLGELYRPFSVHGVDSKGVPRQITIPASSNGARTRVYGNCLSSATELMQVSFAVKKLGAAAEVGPRK